MQVRNVPQKDGMFWRSTAREESMQHQNGRSKERNSCEEATLSKTSIFLGRTMRTENIKNEYCLKQVESPILIPKAQGGFYPKAQGEFYSMATKTDVNIILKFLGNQNASVSASCSLRPDARLSTHTDCNQIGISLPKQQKTFKLVEIPLDEPSNNKNTTGFIRGNESENRKERQCKISSIHHSKFPYLNLSKSEIGSSILFSQRSGNELSNGRDFSDYRVISLDAKPYPGRLEDFVPEIERENNGGMTTEKADSNHPNEKVTEGDEREGSKFLPMERDMFGRLIIPSKEWRKFMSEQRPNTPSKLNCPFELIHRGKDHSGEWKKPIVIASKVIDGQHRPAGNG